MVSILLCPTNEFTEKQPQITAALAPFAPGYTAVSVPAFAPFTIEQAKAWSQTLWPVYFRKTSEYARCCFTGVRFRLRSGRTNRSCVCVLCVCVCVCGGVDG